jgi:hypothetical protein
MGICAFPRGSKSILYANFTDLSGKPFNPPSPKVSVYFKSTLILAPSTMSFSTEKGLFYYVWDVPSTLTIGAYSAVFTGVSDGIEIQTQSEVFIT